MVGRSKVGSRRHVLDPLFVSSPPGREKSSNLSFSPRAASATEKFNFELFVPPGAEAKSSTLNFSRRSVGFFSPDKLCVHSKNISHSPSHLTHFLSPPLVRPRAAQPIGWSGHERPNQSAGQATSGPTTWLVMPRAAQPIGWSGHERPNQSASLATSGPTNWLVRPLIAVSRRRRREIK